MKVRVAVVTGSAHRVGKGIALGLAARAANDCLTILDRICAAWPKPGEPPVLPLQHPPPINGKLDTHPHPDYA